MHTILGFVFGFMAFVVALGITMVVGHSTGYVSAFLVAGAMLSAPFLLLSVWFFSGVRGNDRRARLALLGITLVVLGATRWIGILVVIGPVFAEGSLFLMASGAAILVWNNRVSRAGNA